MQKELKGRNEMTITKNALIKRINRKLAHDGEVLKITRGERARTDLGDYYILDIYHNTIVRSRVDPEALGRKLDLIG